MRYSGTGSSKFGTSRIPDSSTFMKQAWYHRRPRGAFCAIMAQLCVETHIRTGNTEAAEQKKRNFYRRVSRCPQMTETGIPERIIPASNPG